MGKRVHDLDNLQDHERSTPAVPEIAPFCGLHYNTERFGRDWSKLIAPPYDVLDEADKAALLQQEQHNIVGVDLPHVPPKSAGPDEAYAMAAELLQRWIDSEAMIREAQPALYVYHQVYDHAGHTHIRKMFFARMRIEVFGQGTIYPHEQTFGGPKEDRLKLMQTTTCQLSPIFGLYSDPSNSVSAILDTTDREPDVRAVMEGVENRVWIFTDPNAIRMIQENLKTRNVYIADGHHRYGTALNYRDSLGDLPEDHPARFVFTGFCAMEDPGCVILPTHRVLSGFGETKAAAILAALDEGLETTTGGPDIRDVEQLVADDAPHDMAIYLAAGDRICTATFTNRPILDRLAPQQSPAWRELDVAYLHRYLIDELITGKALGGNPPSIQYIKSVAKAVEVARETRGIALLCKACTMEQLRAVSEAGDLMPQKSTFFYPKLATGLIVYPLT